MKKFNFNIKFWSCPRCGRDGYDGYCPCEEDDGGERN